MDSPSREPAGALLQVIGPADNWVLERLARRLATKLPYAEFVSWQPRPTPAARIAYYVNYALYHGPSGLIDVAFFTHLDETQQFLERARRVDHCVCMSRQYADWLRGQGVEHVSPIVMGFDSYRYRPRLVLGVIGTLDHPRKGRCLVEHLRQLPFVEVLTSEGRMAEQELPDLYQRIDYVLIPALVEGGPMSLLEGLAMGKPVIAPAEVGMVPEFGESAYLLRYPAGDAEALAALVTACYQKKLQSVKLVQDRSWDRWAEAHHHLFTRLLRARGEALPAPAPGFRFGLLGELDVPLGVDLERLEDGVDRAATHLYHARYRQARGVLEEMLPSFPFLAKLLETIPAGTDAPLRPRPAADAHAKPLRS